VIVVEADIISTALPMLLHDLCQWREKDRHSLVKGVLGAISGLGKQAEISAIEQILYRVTGNSAVLLIASYA